jgi:adenylate cyclase
VASSRIDAGSRRFLLACGVLPAFIVAILALYRPSFAVRFDDGLYDQTLRWAGTKPSSGRIVVVDVDERSLSRHGQWPWRRDLIARLVARLRDEGAAVVALDIIFPEPERGDDNTDGVFAETLRDGRVVLGYGLTFDSARGGAKRCALHPFSIATVHSGADSQASPFFGATDAVCSLPMLANAAGRSGFLNATPDRDGILRRAPLLAEIDGFIYPSLAVATLSVVTGWRDGIVRVSNDNSSLLTIGDRVVPLDGKSNLLLRFRGEKRTFPYLSAVDVLDGHVAGGALAGKVVLVGTSALGNREVVATPLDTLFVGVEVQATMVDNLLQGDFIRRPEHRGTVEAGATLAGGLVVALLIALCGMTLGTSMAAAVLGAFWFSAVWLLDARGIFVSPLFPTAGWGAALSAVSLARFRLERRRADTAGVETTAARALMIQALLSLTEVRDAETGRHSRRTQQYTKLLAQALSTHPRFRHQLTPDRVELISSLAPLHDIGKVGVPDRILNKPGELTTEELAEMRRHTVYGRDVILNAEKKVLVRDDAVLSLAKEIVYTHHERWDGSGYPEGLQGEDIPVAGRIIAVVDVYDATTTRTLYRPAMSHEKAIAFIASSRGSHFDPAVVDALLRVAPAFKTLASQSIAESIPA